MTTYNDLPDDIRLFLSEAAIDAGYQTIDALQRADPIVRRTLTRYTHVFRRRADVTSWPPTPHLFTEAYLAQDFARYCYAHTLHLAMEAVGLHVPANWKGPNPNGPEPHCYRDHRNTAPLTLSANPDDNRRILLLWHEIASKITDAFHNPDWRCPLNFTPAQTTFLSDIEATDPANPRGPKLKLAVPLHENSFEDLETFMWQLRDSYKAASTRPALRKADINKDTRLDYRKRAYILNAHIERGNVEAGTDFSHFNTTIKQAKDLRHWVRDIAVEEAISADLDKAMSIYLSHQRDRLDPALHPYANTAAVNSVKLAAYLQIILKLWGKERNREELVEMYEDGTITTLRFLAHGCWEAETWFRELWEQNLNFLAIVGGQGIAGPF